MSLALSFQKCILICYIEEVTLFFTQAVFVAVTNNQLDHKCFTVERNVKIPYSNMARTRKDKRAL
jgi:hypothetical protein